MELLNETFSRENQSGDRTKPLRRSPTLSVEGCVSRFANESCVSLNKLLVLEVQNIINQLFPCLHRSTGDSVPTDHNSVTIETLYRWCEQIASGMEYLTTKQVTISVAIHKGNGNDVGRVENLNILQVVHGDLAARNVLVFQHHEVKISDFGMSTSLYGGTLRKVKRRV